ncbi:hypothetical protein ACLKA6_002664 [Drosophila palustris]
MSGSNGQPPNKVRKLNFATNHDEPENPSGTQYTDLRREIDGLRRYIEELGEHLKASQESLAKETKAEIGLLAEKVGTQNAYLRQILQRGAQSTEAQGSTFPISSPEEMIALDLKISPENRQIYITKEMKELLPQANLSKSIKKVLEEEFLPRAQFVSTMALSDFTSLADRLSQFEAKLGAASIVEEDVYALEIRRNRITSLWEKIDDEYGRCSKVLSKSSTGTDAQALESRFDSCYMVYERSLAKLNRALEEQEDDNPSPVKSSKTSQDRNPTQL